MVIGIYDLVIIHLLDNINLVLDEPTIAYVYKELDNDTMRYRATNFTLCDIYHKSNIFLGSHHKTGSVLLNYQLSRKTISPFLKDNCKKKGIKKRKKKMKKHSIFQESYHIDADRIDKWLEKHNKRKTEINRNMHHMVILNIIRNPVDTIISAYNYHYKGSEGWTRKELHEISVPPFKFDEEKENKCTSDLFISLTKSMGLSSNVSIQELYKNILTTETGLHFEYLRYIHCCFDEIYSSYIRINDLLDQNHSIFEYYDANLMHFQNFRMEDFKTQFDESCNRLMDKLGILEKKDRQKLRKKFRKYDLNSQSAEVIAKNKHVTTGKYDKKAQLKLLFNNDAKCNLLKHKTALLKYPWNFDQFC